MPWGEHGRRMERGGAHAADGGVSVDGDVVEGGLGVRSGLDTLRYSTGGWLRYSTGGVVVSIRFATRPAATRYAEK